MAPETRLYCTLDLCGSDELLSFLIEFAFAVGIHTPQKVEKSIEFNLSSLPVRSPPGKKPVSMPAECRRAKA